MSHSDDAVLAGLLTWVRDIAVGRTAVQFTLSLSLDRSYYPNTSVADLIALPGLLHYGDNSELDEAVMMEVQICQSFHMIFNSVTRLSWLLNRTLLLKQFCHTLTQDLVTMAILGKQLTNIVVGVNISTTTGKQCKLLY